jgi:hypothetical protein
MPSQPWLRAWFSMLRADSIASLDDTPVGGLLIISDFVGTCLAAWILGGLYDARRDAVCDWCLLNRTQVLAVLDLLAGNTLGMQPKARCVRVVFGPTQNI